MINEKLDNIILQTDILDAINDCVSIQDQDFKIIYQNQAHQTMAGDSLGKYCYDVLGHKGRICESCPVLASFNDGNAHALQKQTSIKDTSIVLEVTASAIKDGNGHIVAGIEIMRDVTNQRKTEQTLMDAERKYRSLFSTSPDMIFIAERDTGKIIDANKSACMLLGYSREEIIGTVSGERVVPAQKKSYEDEFEKLKTGGLYSGQFDVMRKDGSIMKADVKGVAFDDYLCVIGRDITERNKYEEEIKNKVEELESFYEMAIGRETKMMELKSRIEKLKTKLSDYEMNCNCEHIGDKKDPDVQE